MLEYKLVEDFPKAVSAAQTALTDLYISTEKEDYKLLLVQKNEHFSRELARQLVRAYIDKQLYYTE